MGVKELLPLIGAKSASAWTKRIKTERSDWVPFRLDELAAIVPRLRADDEIGWPYLDETAMRLVSGAFSGSPRVLMAAEPVADVSATRTRRVGPRGRVPSNGLD